MLPRSVQIGPLTLHLYGLIIAISIYFGWLLAKKKAHLHKIPIQILDDPILVIPLVLSIAGARLYHVFDYWDYYSKNPQLILKISGGGLGIWGGITGVLIGFWIVAKVRKINLLALLDLAAPSLLLGQAIGRIGNYINQEGFGPPTNLPWGVYIAPENRPVQFINSTHFHPTFFYEAIIDFIFFILLIYLEYKLNNRHSGDTERREVDSRIKKSRFWSSQNDKKSQSQWSIVNGQLFAYYLIFYSIGRFTVEFFRIDTAQIGTIKVAQVLSILALGTGLAMLIKLKKGDVPS